MQTSKLDLIKEELRTGLNNLKVYAQEQRDKLEAYDSEANYPRPVNIDIYSSFDNILNKEWRGQLLKLKRVSAKELESQIEMLSANQLSENALSIKQRIKDLYEEVDDYVKSYKQANPLHRED